MSAEKIVSNGTQLSPNARRFLEENTLRDIFGIPEDALDAVMATAYQLYQAGRYLEVEVLCRGLIAADHRYWWSYSLYAAALRRMGRLREAVAQLERGLVYEPDAPKLVAMRTELLAEIARETETNGNDSNAAA
jgi:tetratricopeptide (TPR) repeat protein